MVEIPQNPTKRNHIYLIYMLKEDLALNNLQNQNNHKTKTKLNHIYLVYLYKKDSALNNG